MQTGITLLSLTGVITIPLFAGVVAAPEIDSSSATAAIGVICGAVLLIRNRKKK